MCALATIPRGGVAQDSNVDESFLLDSIVVRGDKVGRTTDDAPPSLSVVEGEVAEAPQNRDVDDIIDAEPNVLANEGFKPPSIRGIDGLGGDRAAITAGSQTRIPILIDDVPVPSGEASLISTASTWDIETVEVARGPQPTSTGRNALGGAIRVYTRDPVFEPETALRTFYTDEAGTVGGAFMLNAPLPGDQLAVRLTSEYSLGQSYVDISPDPVPAGFDPEKEERLRLRGKVLFEPEALPELSTVISVEYADLKGPTEGFFSGDPDDFSIASPFFLASSYEEVEQIVYSARGSYDISPNLTFVGRASRLKNDLLFASTGESLELFPGFTIDAGDTSFEKDLTELEAYVQVDDIGVLQRGVVGSIYSREDEEAFGTAGLEFSADGQIENIGFYGEAELSADAILPGLSIILGGRLEIDKRERESEAPSGTPAGSANFDEEVFLPKVGIRYDVMKDVSIGYTYSRGFRGGGLDVDLGAPLSGLPITSAAFGPEYLDQHEIFLKSSHLNGRIDVGASAFYYIWEDAQVPGGQTYPTGGAALGNVPEAVGRGLELSATFRATETITLSGALGLLDTEITEVNSEQAALSGDELPRAPNTTASLRLGYAPGNGFDAAVQMRHITETASALGQPELDAYTIVDIDAGYEFDTGRGQSIRLEAFVENVFDERYLTFIEEVAIPGFDDLRKVGQPRTFGLAATLRF